MKKTFILLLLCMFLSGCNQNTTISEETTIPAPTVMLEDIYTPALDILLAKNKIAMTVTVESEIQAYNEVLQTTQSKEIRYSPSAAQISTIIDYGQYELSTLETCIDDTVYLSVNGNLFQGSMPLDNFLSLQIPVDVVHADLYDTILLSNDNGMTHIQFTDPNSAEAWLAPKDATMTSAYAEAVLNSKYELESVKYEIKYQIQDVLFHYSVSVDYATFTEAIEKPEGEFVLVKDPQGPILAENAYGLLLQTTKANCSISKNVYSQADSTQYVNTVIVSRGDNEYTVSTTTSLSDPSLDQESQTQIQLEEYKNGVYSMTVDGEPTDHAPNIDGQNMQQYCLDLLTGNMVSSKYFSDSTSEIVDGKKVITYTGNEALAQVLCRNGCKILYRDENFLDSQTDHFEDYHTTFQLVIDPLTGLPESCQIEFYGIHHINGINYRLESSDLQTFLY